MAVESAVEPDLVKAGVIREDYHNVRLATNSDELWNWVKKVIDGQVERKSGSIVVCDDAGDEIMRYTFYEAWPCRWKTNLLSARHRGTMIEEIEIVTEKIERG